MRLSLLGHAAVLLESSSGQTLLVDPYESGGYGGAVGYAPIQVSVDFVTCTHDHLDHAATHTLGEGVREVAEGRAGDFVVTRYACWHDEYEGRRRGGAVDILEIEVDGVRVVHASDVGQAPDAEVVRALRAPDVLLVPTGGFYTIGSAQAWEWTERLAPRWVIPIHYKTEACGFGIDGLEVFESYFDEARDRVRRLDTSVFGVDDCRRGGFWAPTMKMIPNMNDSR